MKIQPYVSKLHGSNVYRDFQQKNKDAFLVAGFFVIDFETGSNLHQIDYYVPSKKKFAAFTLDHQVQVQLMNSFDKRVPNQLDMKTHIDLDALRGIIQDEMKNRNITQSIKKMIAVIQNLEGRSVWNVNCVLSGMDLLRVHVEDKSETVLKMERSSLMDYVKRLPAPVTNAAAPGAVGQQPVQPQSVAPASGEQSSPQAAQPAAPKATRADIERKIAQLDKLKQLLKEEEGALDKQEAFAQEKAAALKSANVPARAVKAKSKKK